MGLLKAGLGAAGGVMADQWKEFIWLIFNLNATA